MIDPAATALTAADEALRRSRRAGRMYSDPSVQTGIGMLGMPVDRARRRRLSATLDLARLRGAACDMGVIATMAARAGRHALRPQFDSTDGMPDVTGRVGRDAGRAWRVTAPSMADVLEARVSRSVAARREVSGGSQPVAQAPAAPPPPAIAGMPAGAPDGARVHTARQKAAAEGPRRADRQAPASVETHRLSTLGAIALQPSRPVLPVRAVQGMARQQVILRTAKAAGATWPTRSRAADMDLADGPTRRQAFTASPAFSAEPDTWRDDATGDRRASPKSGPPDAVVRLVQPGAAIPSVARQTGRNRSDTAAPVAGRGERPMERGMAAPRRASEQAREAQMSGTIVLDGAELGRWIMDHLAQAASRPPAGSTAFDPRMTPVWAGASIGG